MSSSSPSDAPTSRSDLDAGNTTKQSDLSPPLEHNLNLEDFEQAGKQLLSSKAWAYYRSAADFERAYESNMAAWSKVTLRPRVLRGIARYDISTTILGFPSSAPIIIAPAAQAQLAHLDGEKAVVRAAAAHGLIYGLSSNASMSPEEVMSAAAPGQVLFYQIYVNVDRKGSIEVLKRVKRLGYKAIIVTADGPIPGKRTLDDRHALADDYEPNPIPARFEGQETKQEPVRGSVASAGAIGIDADVKWADLKWIREASGLPLIVKGIMTAEDAAICAQKGVEAIWLSNHGGRQLEDTPVALETLLEIRRHCPHVLKRCEVYLDGGVRHGADAIKAICLGAKAVAVGRPFMYSLAYGEAGPRRVAHLLSEESAICMRLLGCNNLSQLHAGLVNTKRLDDNLTTTYDGPRPWPWPLSRL